jgi:hypothetical protein
MTDAEILTLVDRLERCLPAKEDFHHRDHLTVAVVYLYSADLETAMNRMRQSEAFCRTSWRDRVLSRDLDTVLAHAGQPAAES